MRESTSGHNPTLGACPRLFRSPESGPRRTKLRCRLWAKRRHDRSCLACPKKCSEILIVSLLANSSPSQSIHDFVVLTPKLRIARTCVANLLKPLDREIRSYCVQFGQHLPGHFHSV